VKGESNSKSKSGSKSRSKRDKADKDVPHPGLTWLNHLCACSEVSCCASKEQIHKKEKKEKRRDKERKEKRKEKGVAGDSVETSVPDPDPAGCEDGDSGESCTSHGTESACSTARSTRSARSVCDSENEATSGRRSRGVKSSSKKPAPGTDVGGVRVLNLADIRGQKLPNSLHHGGKEEEAPQSARSSRSAASEGGRSGRSCRSDAQSEGGRSVASVSVKKYMGYLSEPKSPSEVKRMVKDLYG